MALIRSRGISPIVGTVLIVMVTLIAAVAIAGFVFGPSLPTWRSGSTGPDRRFQITRMASIKTTFVARLEQRHHNQNGLASR
ncbi:MAG: type IV pilin N-terminal domain-containing protein [Nitrososphaerota archaeon]|nr:type IV pilin N-terminal domain-containing protein [Nitrososphaerota archaeon]MDG7024184.1 type IV pilin N-terminal domain-containing protein [Nitrososphaerota archaeon]